MLNDFWLVPELYCVFPSTEALIVHVPAADAVIVLPSSPQAFDGFAETVMATLVWEGAVALTTAVLPISKEGRLAGVVTMTGSFASSEDLD